MPKRPDKSLHPSEYHPALYAARKALADYDNNRDAYEIRDLVKSMTNGGMTEGEIAKSLNRHERCISRWKTLPIMQRPQLPEADDERANELEELAELGLYLADLLRDEDPNLVWETLTRLTVRQLLELAVIALAAIPTEMTTEQLFGWVLSLPEAKIAS